VTGFGQSFEPFFDADQFIFDIHYDLLGNDFINQALILIGVLMAPRTNGQNAKYNS